MSQITTYLTKKKQYIILWYIVFSIVIAKFLHTYALEDQTVLSLNVEYWLTGNLTINWPSWIILKNWFFYTTWAVDLLLSSSTSANADIITSESTILYQSGSHSLWSNFSYTVTWDDRLIAISWNLITNVWYWLNFKELLVFKDATAPVHSWNWNSKGSSIYDSVELQWPVATDTGIWWVYYSVSVEWVSWPWSGFLYYVTTSNTSLIIWSSIFYPWEYNITIIAYDELWNSSAYWSNTIVLDETTTEIQTGWWWGGGAWWWGGGYIYDVCLCWDYSWDFSDYLCSPSWEWESSYISNYCDNVFYGSGETHSIIDEDLAPQWLPIVQRFLDLLWSIPSMDYGYIKLPNDQVIVWDMWDIQLSQLDIILQRLDTWSVLEIERPYIQWTLNSGYLYITYIEQPKVDTLLCLNCCYLYRLPYNFPYESYTLVSFFFYVRRCEPYYLLLILLIITMLLLMIKLKVKKKYKNNIKKDYL